MCSIGEATDKIDMVVRECERVEDECCGCLQPRVGI